ncbi:MAG: response regulator [Planctomycetota bacterium]|nr:response regulator [Planctomycetota bacterium]
MVDEAKTFPGKKILVVDDDRDILEALQTALAGLGVEVFTASDGELALTQAEAHKPDLVVLDMMLPKRSGFLVMERLRRGKKKSEPPRIIMVTGNQGHRHKTFAQTMGADDYMNKPFRMEKLLASVTKILSAAQAGPETPA